MFTIKSFELRSLIAVGIFSLKSDKLGRKYPHEVRECFKKITELIYHF